MSRVSPSLFVFGPWNMGDHSQKRSSVIGRAALKRSPSGRLVGLDVDDLGAQHGEEVTDERAGPERGEVQALGGPRRAVVPGSLVVDATAGRWSTLGCGDRSFGAVC